MATKVTLSKDKKQLVITIDVENPLTVSASGKSKVVASTRGNLATDILIEGKPVMIGLNAYIKNG